jgi:SAM-dependent methyltransferase
LEPKLAPLHIVTTPNTSDTDLLENLRWTQNQNFREMEATFEPTRDRPLLVVGSGPSALKYLAKLPPGEYDIMALNGAYRTLVKNGYVPDYYAQLDARAANVNFVESILPETRVLLASQVHRDVFAAVPASQVEVFHLNTPLTQETFGSGHLYVGGAGGTVGMTALALAPLLGYRHLILLGYDSSFCGEGRSHMEPQPQNANQQIIDAWVGDRRYWTTPSLAHQVSDFFTWNKALHAAFPDIAIDLLGEGLFYDWVVTNQNAPPKTRENEAAKYADAYNDPQYRMPVHRRAGIRDILGYEYNRGLRSVLDVGTGRGETLTEAEDMGYELIYGTETVDVLCGDRVVRALLPELPFYDEEFDLVTCFEVLEHLLPADLEAALLELKRVATRRVVVSVCTNPDIRGGVNLHPSHMPEADWIALLKRVWQTDTLDELGNFSLHGVSPVYGYTKA